MEQGNVCEGPRRLVRPDACALTDRVHARKVCDAPPGYVKCVLEMAVGLDVDGSDLVVRAKILGMYCG